MSIANLNVWITKIGDPCHMTDLEYFVHVFDCEGKLLEYCGKTYSFIPAKCGHVSIDVPPGCYVLFAGQDPKGVGIPPFGNLLTHVQIVRVNCGDHACVTLFAPSLHFCGTWFGNAVGFNGAGLRAANIDPKLATAAVEAVNALLAKVTIDPFTENTLAVAKR